MSSVFPQNIALAISEAQEEDGPQIPRFYLWNITNTKMNNIETFEINSIQEDCCVPLIVMFRNTGEIQEENQISAQSAQSHLGERGVGNNNNEQGYNEIIDSGEQMSAPENMGVNGIIMSENTGLYGLFCLEDTPNNMPPNDYPSDDAHWFYVDVKSVYYSEISCTDHICVLPGNYMISINSMEIIQYFDHPGIL